MTKHTISVTHEKKNLSITISGLYTFKGFQIMEGYTEHMEECYYLFFYRDHFLTAKKTTKIKRNSTLHEILTSGIYIPSPSPIIQFLITANSIKSFPTVNTTWKTINQKYDQIEAAFILTIFDAYLKKDTILSTFDKIWTQLRRDGKLAGAYRILHLTLTRYPKNKWAKSLSSHLDYSKYVLIYQSDIKTLLAHDPLLAEKQLFTELDNQRSFTLLDHKLRVESRSIERIALYCDKLKHNDVDFTQHYQNLVAILPTHFSKKEAASILFTVLTQSISTDHHEKIKKELFQLVAKNDQYEETFQLLAARQKPLTSIQLDVLINVLEHLAPSYSINFEDFKATLLENANPDQVQALLTAIVPRLFNKKHDIQFIYQWIQPFQTISHPLIEKIKLMYKINDDADQQHYMGEMYYELNQLERAVECFLWDFELNPTNPRPIKWLTKLYRELGMKEESESYMYLYKQIQKSS